MLIFLYKDMPAITINSIRDGCSIYIPKFFKVELLRMFLENKYWPILYFSFGCTNHEK